MSLKAVASGVGGGGGGSGTVTQVNTGTGLTGGPITDTGTISVATGTVNSLAGYNATGTFSNVTVGTGLSLSGGTLTSTGSGGTITATGSPSSGNLTKFSGATSITNGDLSGDVTTAGTLVTTVAAIAGTTVAGTTGTGSVVFGTSPALTTPILGTPTSGTLTNCTGLPVTSGVSGLGAGVATFLATPSSANLASAVTDETGSGSLVFGTSPTFTTPILGTPTSGTLTNCTGLPITTGTTGTLTETRGGTNQTTYTKGDVLGATAANTLGKVAVGSDGQGLIADTNSTAGLNWFGLGVGGMTYTSGRYYGPIKTNTFSTSAFANSTTIYSTPIYIWKRQAFAGIGVNITTTGTATQMRLGVYSMLASGLPGNILFDGGTVAVATTGQKTASTSNTVNPGWYYAVGIANGTCTTSALGTATQLYAFLFGTTDCNTEPPRYTSTGQTFGTLPSTYGTATLQDATGQTPYIALQV